MIVTNAKDKEKQIAKLEDFLKEHNRSLSQVELLRGHDSGQVHSRPERDSRHTAAR